MELKKVWMSPETGKKSQYGSRAVGGILGIVFLMTVLLFTGTFLSLSFGLPQQSFSMILVLFATALSIALAVRMGYRGMQDATIFFLTENDRLWVMDARGLSSHGDGFLGFAISSMETQAFVRRQGKQPFLPKGADEILKVLSIKDFLVKGIQDEQMLLQELERRKTWENVLEPAENRNPLYILLSGAAFIFCVILCILSHPSVARMSGEIYFPCMGASMVTFCFLLYFIIRQHRGE